MPRARRVSLPVVNERWRRPIAHPMARARPGVVQVPEGPQAAEVRQTLDIVLGGLRAYRVGGAPFVLSLRALASSEAAGLIHALGEGELSIAVRGLRAQAIRETALAGLWRVDRDFLVVADVPPSVRAADTGRQAPAELPPLPLLDDLRSRAQEWEPGDPTLVVSLARLDEAALDDADEWLGRGPVVAESHGLAHCRVALTAHPHVWSVQHRNGLGELLIDSLEVGDVPAAITAAQEDFADSADRLASLLRT